jgi:predicted transposase/invertase (TIGR01784 family)
MIKISTPHDAIAKHFLSNVEVAKDFLEVHLPDEIKNCCELSSLEVESTSFIEKNLRQHFSDILYKVNAKSDPTDICYIYTVVEHQSTPDWLMPFRILRYQVAIINRHLETHKDQYDKNENIISKKLPIVFPLVLYNGQRSPYPHDLNLADLFENRDFARAMPLGNFKLIDLTITSDADILQHKKVALLEMVQKHVVQRDFKQAMSSIIEALHLAHDIKLSNDIVGSVFVYLMNTLETDEVDELFNTIKLKVPYYEENIMTYAESKKQEGKQEGKMEVAHELKTLGIPLKDIQKATGLSPKQIEEL